MAESSLLLKASETDELLENFFWGEETYRVWYVCMAD